MHYGTIKNCDIANGIGVRVSLFVSGCRNRCPGCFQPETWEFDYGQPFTEQTANRLIALLRPDYIDGLTLLGGEPFEPENQPELLALVRRVRQNYPQKTVWAFTGYTLETLLSGAGHPCCEATLPLLHQIDVLVDGRFEQAQKNLRLRFRGSENQRLIDLPASLASGRVVLWD